MVPTPKAGSLIKRKKGKKTMKYEHHLIQIAGKTISRKKQIKKQRVMKFNEHLDRTMEK